MGSYHLLVETCEPNLSRAMQWLTVSDSVWFNRRHGRSGHLFQGRYKAILLDPLGWGLELSRYVHLNPVRVMRQGLPESPWEHLTAQVVLGGAESVRTMRQKGREDRREQTAVRHLRARPRLSEVSAAVEAVQGER